MPKRSNLKLAAAADRGDESWTEEARCVDKTHLFFAPPGERLGRRNRREAKARSYCNVCPVVDECRNFGRVNRENGIWGGENDEERALAGFAPRNIFRRGVAAARRQGLDSGPHEDAGEPR